MLFFLFWRGGTRDIAGWKFEVEKKTWKKGEKKKEKQGGKGTKEGGKKGLCSVQYDIELLSASRLPFVSPPLSLQHVAFCGVPPPRSEAFGTEWTVFLWTRPYFYLILILTVIVSTGKMCQKPAGTFVSPTSPTMTRKRTAPVWSGHAQS